NLSPSVGAPAPGAKGAWPVRTEAVLLQKIGQPPSTGRSTRPGCEGCLAGSHRGGAPTKKPANPSPPVGAPAPGAKGAWPVRPAAVLLQNVAQPPPPGRSTRPGSERCRAGSHVGGAPTNRPPAPSPPVGAPAPGAKGAGPVRTGAVLLQKSRSTSSTGRSTRP